MTDIMIKCPTTGRDVPVGIDTDQVSFDRLPNTPASMTCPACGKEHIWSKSEAWLNTTQRRNPLPEPR
jgi:endogenous inhibitor of DNA gyrase (YacG/DUF329 family)